MRAALTPRQRHLLDFVQAYTEQHGHAPSFEEIRDAIGVASISSVHGHVENLVRKGYLWREHNRLRSIQIIPEDPLIDGTVTAGDVRCARALLELVGDEAAAVEPLLREEAVRVARELLGPVALQNRGALALIGAGRERLSRRALRR